MGFSVLKDPSDPRNFIVGPAVGTTAPVDPNLIQQGLAAGAAQGLPGTRPKSREIGERQFKEEEGRFGGPGDPRQFRRGLINLHGRLLKKTFEKNREQLFDDFNRAGGTVTPELTAQVNTALQSTGGFDAARDVMKDFRDAQPDRVAQRAVDLEALQNKAQRDSVEQLARTQEIQNRNEIFKYDLGLPPAKVAEDREKFNRRMTLAGRVQDAQVLSDFFGTVRFGEMLSSEKAAVKQAYADIKREMTIGIGAFSEAGALSDQERDFFGEFAGQFTTLSPIQDSARRVALADAMNFLSNGADDIKQANRALLAGARPAIWNVEKRTPDQVLAREVPGGLNLLTEAEIAAEAQKAQTRVGDRAELRERADIAEESIPSAATIRTGLSGPRAEIFEGIEGFIKGLPAQLSEEIEGIGENLRRQREQNRPVDEEEETEFLIPR